MHAPRVSISGLMGVVAVVAVGVFGLKEGTATWAGITCMLTLGLLVAATLAAAFGRRGDRPGWVGFALTGWVFLLASMNPWGGSAVPMPPMPTEPLIAALNEEIHPPPQYIPNPRLAGSPNPGFTVASFPTIEPSVIIRPGTPVWRGDLLHVRQSAHALLALVFAAIGGLGARHAFGRADRESSMKDGPAGSDPRPEPLP